MHVLIINGSPRIKKFSNTDKILEKFNEGLSENGNTYELYEVSDRKQWDTIREAFGRCDDILIAIPLFVESIPGLLLEFLETVTPRNNDARIAYILQGGFAEGSQLRCGERYLEILSRRLGCIYKGTLVKGNNFGIRLVDDKDRDKITVPYKAMGSIYGRDGSFDAEDCRKFTGPEYFPLPVRLMVGFIFRTFARKGFTKMAASWGCTEPLDARPYEI